MNQPHPMLLPLRELLRREIGTAEEMLRAAERLDAFTAIATSPHRYDQFQYILALDSLHDWLREHEQAVLVPSPGFSVWLDTSLRRWVVFGWHHVLQLPDGSKIHPKDEISWHHYRWTAKRAANRWLKRAQVVSSRISTELSQALEGAR